MFQIPQAANIHDPGVFWSLAILCAVFVGLSKTGVPGIGILTVGIMANLFDTGKSTGLLLPMLVIGDIFTVLYYRRHAVWKYVLKTMPWGMAGIVGGWLAQRLYTFEPVQMKRMVGAIVLGVLVMGLLVPRNKDEFSVPNRWWFAALIGVLGGFATMTANAAGPIWIVYLLAMHIPKDAFLGTGGWIFMILNVFKLPFSHNLGYITADSLLFDIAMIPAIGAGALFGVLCAKRIPERGFTIAVKLLATAAALRLIVG